MTEVPYDLDLSTRPPDDIIRRLADERDVARLVISYMTCVDRRLFDRVAAHFLDEVTVDYTSLRPDEPARIVLASDLVEEWRQRHTPILGYQHHLGNVLPTIQGDAAQCSASGFATHFNDRDGAKSAWHLGLYYDFGMTRTVDGWRIGSIRATKIWEWMPQGGL
jgi:hypothetical protein